MIEENLEVMILVKAYPIFKSNHDEVSCVAAMTLDEHPRWIRLFPIPFRDLEDETKFKKYQEIRLTVKRPTKDSRPESFTPISGTIQPGQLIGTKKKWATRRERVHSLGESVMCDLINTESPKLRSNASSLAVIRTREKPKLSISERDEEDKEKWEKHLKAIASQPSLFGGPATRKPALEYIPWDFHYHYYCLNSNCKGHTQSIIDWEVAALWRRVRGESDWKDQMKKKLCDEMWADNRDTVLFVGSHIRYPTTFLVLGVFWPPNTPFQQSFPLHNGH